MEPAKDAMSKAMANQPEPVVVSLTGGRNQDVDYWMRILMRAAEFKGDTTQMKHGNIFTIYPRAVND